MEFILLFYCLNYFLVGVMVTVALIIAEWILFERAGQAGWKSLIPFYDSFIIHKIAFGERCEMVLVFVHHSRIRYLCSICLHEKLRLFGWCICRVHFLPSNCDSCYGASRPPIQRTIDAPL